jgi:hypothetical protein
MLASVRATSPTGIPAAANRRATDVAIPGPAPTMTTPVMIPIVHPAGVFMITHRG